MLGRSGYGRGGKIGPLPSWPLTRTTVLKLAVDLDAIGPPDATVVSPVYQQIIAVFAAAPAPMRAIAGRTYRTALLKRAAIWIGEDARALARQQTL